MAKKGTIEDSGFKVFQKPGISGDTIAVNLETGVVVETDGKGKFFLYVSGRQHPIAGNYTLEEIVGLPASE